MKKHLKTAAIVLLNVLVCVIVIRDFTRTSIMRPWAGSAVKEAICAVLLLGSLYANYFLLYPKLYPKYPKIYWVTMCLVSVIVGVTDIAIAYPFIARVNTNIIQIAGPFTFISRILGLTVGRDLALNCFLFLIRDRNRSQQSLEKETKIVYERVRMLDVTDRGSNIHLIAIDDIFYCLQQGNFTNVITVQNEAYTRLGSMKHLEQLFGAEEFIRISPTLLVPFRYIQSCENNVLIMKKMSWEKEPTAFKLEPKTGVETAERVSAGLLRHNAAKGGNENSREPFPTAKRKPATPSEEKVQGVLAYIENHPNCNSADIIAETEYSLSTVERCLFELKRQGVIEHTGSKKSGGYKRV